MQLPHWPLMRGYRDVELGLARVRELLARLGHPEQLLPPVIHVAGTNGKGSVVAYLRAIYEQSGLKCHVYTSPHLVEFNERIVISSQIIADDYLFSTLETCRVASSDLPVTFFEGTTIAALLAFSEQPADVVLLETGLGGRLDATNVIEKPALTIITSISIDHKEFLGDTLAQIAGEKAGIIKPGVPCITAPQPPEVMAVLECVAKERGAELIVAEPYSGALPLIGEHQQINAGVALKAASLLGFVKDDIEPKLSAAKWPARLQHLTQGKLAELLPEHCELWLDGGHNPAAGEALAAQAGQWADAPLYLITAMLKDKDTEAFLHPLAPYAAHLYAVPILNEDGAKAPDTIATIAKEQGMDASIAACVKDALEAIRRQHAAPFRVLICGSLYLAGSVLAENDGIR